MKTFVEEYSNKFNGASGDMISLYDAAKFTSELLKQERNKAIDEYCDRLKEGIRTEPERTENWSVEEIIQLVDILKREFTEPE